MALPSDLRSMAENMRVWLTREEGPERFHAAGAIWAEITHLYYPANQLDEAPDGVVRLLGQRSFQLLALVGARIKAPDSGLSRRRRERYKKVLADAETAFWGTEPLPSDELKMLVHAISRDELEKKG